MTTPIPVAPKRTRMSTADKMSTGVLFTIAALALLMLLAPSVIVIAISFTEKAYIGFPPTGFTFKWYGELIGMEQIIDSSVTSLKIAAMTTVFALAIGVPAAMALVRGKFRGRALATAFIVSPQMLPGMVIGIAILFYGAYMAFYQSNLMVTVAMTAFCLPFAVRLAMARMATLDPTLDEASEILGATKVQTFFRVTVPQMMPAVIAAGAFVFIEAFDNITVALFTSSPRSRPLSVELYNLIQFDSSPVVAALSSLEIMLAILIMVVLARSIGLERLKG